VPARLDWSSQQFLWITKPDFAGKLSTVVIVGNQSVRIDSSAPDGDAAYAPSEKGAVLGVDLMQDHDASSTSTRRYLD